MNFPVLFVILLSLLRVDAVDYDDDFAKEFNVAIDPYLQLTILGTQSAISNDEITKIKSEISAYATDALTSQYSENPYRFKIVVFEIVEYKRSIETKSHNNLKLKVRKNESVLRGQSGHQTQTIVHGVKITLRGNIIFESSAYAPAKRQANSELIEAMENYSALKLIFEEILDNVTTINVARRYPFAPTSSPSVYPSIFPSNTLTSEKPSGTLTVNPSPPPSDSTIPNPSFHPTQIPTQKPTRFPSTAPTAKPSNSLIPSSSPTTSAPSTSHQPSKPRTPPPTELTSTLLAENLKEHRESFPASIMYPVFGSVAFFFIIFSTLFFVQKRRKKSDSSGGGASNCANTHKRISDDSDDSIYNQTTSPSSGTSFQTDMETGAKVNSTSSIEESGNNERNVIFDNSLLDKEFESRENKASPKVPLNGSKSQHQKLCAETDTPVVSIIANSAAFVEEMDSKTPNMSNMSGNGRCIPKPEASGPKCNATSEFLSFSGKIPDFTKIVCAPVSTSSPRSCRDSSPITDVTPTRVSKEEFEMDWDVDLPYNWDPINDTCAETSGKNDNRNESINILNVAQCGVLDGSFPTLGMSAETKKQKPKLKKTNSRDSSAYQTVGSFFSREDQHPLDWSNKGSEHDGTSLDDSTLTDGDGARREGRVVWEQYTLNEKKRKAQLGLNANDSAVFMTPQSSPAIRNTEDGNNNSSPALSRNSSTYTSSSANGGSSHASSKQLINDLVWLEKKIADVRERVDRLDGEETPYSSPQRSQSSSIRDKASPITGNIVCRDCIAPPGKLHIVIHSTKDGPTIYSVRPGSSLQGKVFPGDLLVAVDDVDTRTYSAEAVMEMMVAKNIHERKLTVLHFDEQI